MQAILKRVLPSLLAVAAAVGGLQAYGCYQRSVGELRATVRARDAAIVLLEGRKAQRDTVYVRVRDTLRLVRTRTDSLLVLIPGDTVTRIRVDTVRQMVERERIACDAVIASCEVRVAIRDTLIDSLRVQLKAERGKDRLPLFHVKLPGRLTSAAVGLGAGLLGGLLLGR